MPFEGRSLILRFNSLEPTNSETLSIEKENLFCVFKLIIKDLLECSSRNERQIEKEYFPLKHFFFVFEQILLHGFTGKKTFPMANRKDLWPIIELISRKCTDAQSSEILMSTKEMTNVRTNLGRVRAWLRLAFMHKRLAFYFKILIEQKQDLREFYDSDSLILSDESAIISGLLVGLNAVDFNCCLKETVLDYPVESTIRYSLYLRERRGSDETFSSDETTLDDQTNSVEQRLAKMVDQNHYLEELNRNLEQNLSTFQERLNHAQQSHQILLEEAVAKINAEKELLELSFQRKIEKMHDHEEEDILYDTFTKRNYGLSTLNESVLE